jgi:hypothetical protein
MEKENDYRYIEIFCVKWIILDFFMHYNLIMNSIIMLAWIVMNIDMPRYLHADSFIIIYWLYVSFLITCHLFAQKYSRGKLSFEYLVHNTFENYYLYAPSILTSVYVYIIRYDFCNGNWILFSIYTMYCVLSFLTMITFSVGLWFWYL